MNHARDLHPTYDSRPLAELRDCDPDGSLVLELIGVFLEDTPRRVNALRLAFDAGDPAALSHEAHALKSSCAQMGAMALSEHCRWLEDVGRRGSLAGVDDRLQLVDRELAAARTALLAERDRAR